MGPSTVLMMELVSLSRKLRIGDITQDRYDSELSALKARTRQLGWYLDDGVNKHRLIGLEYGFPDCCVEQFCLDTKNKLRSGLMRGSYHKFEMGRYVPCWTCLSNRTLSQNYHLPLAITRPDSVWKPIGSPTTVVTISTVVGTFRISRPEDSEPGTVAPYLLLEIPLSPLKTNSPPHSSLTVPIHGYELDAAIRELTGAQERENNKRIREWRENRRTTSYNLHTTIEDEE